MPDQRWDAGTSGELVSGADEDGLVTMTVTADRGFVVEVALAATWRRVIASVDLAGTVLRAFHAAQAAATARQLETPAPTAPGSEDGVAAPEYVRNLVLTVLDQLDAYVGRVAQVRAVRFDAESPQGAVTVLTRGGQVAAVTIEPEWARRAPVSDLAREIRAAFVAAQSRAAELVLEIGGPTREMSELTELAMDPVRFVGLVGMRGGEVDRT